MYECVEHPSRSLETELRYLQIEAWYVNGTGASDKNRAVSLDTASGLLPLTVIHREEYGAQKSDQIQYLQSKILPLLSPTLHNFILKIGSENSAFVQEAFNLVELILNTEKKPQVLVSHSQGAIPTTLAAVIIKDIQNIVIPVISIAPPLGKQGSARLGVRYARESLRRLHEVTNQAQGILGVIHAYIKITQEYLGNMSQEFDHSLLDKIHGLSSGLFEEVLEQAGSQKTAALMVHRNRDILFPTEEIASANVVMHIVVHGHHTNPLAGKLPIDIERWLSNFDTTHGRCEEL